MPETDLNNPEVERLVELLKQGDGSAQESFFRSYWDRVYFICVRILHDNANACDVALDVLTDFIYTYVHKITTTAAVGSYIRLMAVRRSLRYKERMYRAGDEAHLERLADVGCSPEERANATVIMPRLDSCLSELTPKAQQVIRLRFGKEMTNETIGSLVGGSKQYIGKLIRKSLETLKRCLQKSRSDV